MASGADEPKPDIVLGLTRAVGVKAAPIVSEIYEFAGKINYVVIEIHVSDLMESLPGVAFAAASNDDYAAYVIERSDVGDELRKRYGADVLAFAASAAIAQKRPSEGGHRGVIYVLDSLLNPEEVRYLRAAYGPAFFLIGVFDDIEARRSALIDRVRTQHYQETARTEEVVDGLLQRNDGVAGPKTALSVERTFHLSDVFVSAQDQPHVRRPAGYGDAPLSVITIRRFLEALFSARNATPNGYETGMAHAYVAARRSASLARQVGAAVVDDRRGDVLAVGYNDVPAPGGGQYPVAGGEDGEMLDVREFRFQQDEQDRGVDTNDLVKWDLISDLLQKLRSLPEVKVEGEDHDVLAALGASGAKVLDVISYTRSVHAEMSAITAAARRGISIMGATLYCTTYPCHECARHIVAAGIRRVIYIEPYPKSRVAELFPDSITTYAEAGDRRVQFLPFVGVSPNRHDEVFSPLTRKVRSELEVDRGRAIDPEPLPPQWFEVARPRFISETPAPTAAVIAGSHQVAENFAVKMLDRLRQPPEVVSDGR